MPMNRITGERTRWGLMLGLLLVAVLPASAAAQKVPIDFNDFHGYTGTVDYLQKVARAYPELTELIEIGQSDMGHRIYVLAVSNMRTGATIDRFVELRNPRQEGVKNVTPMKNHQGKPAQWIDGGTHGNEYTGTEVCLYIIDQLVTGYAADPEIKRLVDDNVFYICPTVNPDGVFNSVEKDISQRQNSMALDDDGDGKVNEDGPDDLNGDGHITSFRYRDPEGQYVVDEVDPRLMIRLGRGETTTRERWSVVNEDKDNDGDGRRGEDPERGIDVNRNYPEGWFNDDDLQGGSGYYAASSPEARAILEFFTNHTNILFAQSFHTSGGFTYRPFARWPDSRLAPKDVAVYDRIMGRKYLELLGVEVPAAWLDQPAAPAPAAPGGRPAQGQAPPAAAARGAARPATTPARAPAFQFPYEWKQPYNVEQGRPYGYGIFIDWAYAQYGAYSMTTELWNSSKDQVGMPEFTGDDARLQRERWLLKYQDEKAGGRFFLPWKRFRHPELGDGEVGGWIPKYTGGNATPGESLLKVCDTHWQFEKYKATLLPKLAITRAEAKVLYTTDNAAEVTLDQTGDRVTVHKGRGTGRYRVVEVTVEVANQGPLATHLDRGASLAGNRQDAIWLVTDRAKTTFLQGGVWQRLGVLEGVMPIPGFAAAATAPTARGAGGGRAPAAPAMPAGMPGFRMQQGGDEVSGSGSTRTVRWLIAVEGDAPLKVVLTSQKGGTVVMDVPVK